MEDEAGNEIAKKEMQVHIYPEVNTQKKNGRWYLRGASEGVTETEPIRGLRRAVEQFAPRRKAKEETGYGTLWKREDSYFTPEAGKSRYDLNGIKQYAISQNKQPDVDGQKLDDDPATGKPYYCGPNNQNPLTGETPVACTSSLPQHATEEIDTIVFERADLERIMGSLEHPDEMKSSGPPEDRE